MDPRSLHIRLLSGFSITDGGVPIAALHTPRLQALLAFLLLHRDTPQPRRHIAFCLWPDSSEAQAQTNLRNLVHQLRRLLPRADALICLDGRTIHWRAEAPIDLDVAQFAHAIAQAEHERQRGEHGAERACLEAAMGHYRGDLLPSCYDEWIAPERERLRQQFSAGLGRLATLCEAQRDEPAAIGYAQRLIQIEPLSEASYLQLMRLHALSGNRAAALQVYQACADLVQRELGAEPGALLRKAYAQLLIGSTSTPSPTSATPLIGRRQAWAQLLRCWESAAAERPQLALLIGESGIGKTRLAEELLRWADRQGIGVARAQCYAAEGDLAYAPAISWLREPTFRAALAELGPRWSAEIARLAPDLGGEPAVAAPAPRSEPWQRLLLFEALARPLLGAGQRLILMLDDLQWCDQETLAWLHYLLRAGGTTCLLLVGTLRAEEAAAAEGLASLLAALREQGQLAEISLEALSEAETIVLATKIAGRELTDAQGAAIYCETEGNPLFIVETVRAGYAWQEARQLGAFAADAPPGGGPLPPRVQAVITSRITRLSPLAAEIAGAAAAIGRAFSFAVLARTCHELDEDILVRGLDELWRRRVIREQGAQGYDFSHEKLREAAYQRLSQVRRRLLHRRLAEALEALHAGQLDGVSAQLAAHYQHAGNPERAALAYQRAAEAARRRYAYGDAIRYQQQAICLHDVAAGAAAQPSAALRSASQEGLGALLAAVERHSEAREAYARALELTPSGGEAAARLQRLIGNTWRAQAQFDQAARAYLLAAEALGPLADDAPPRWHEWVELQLDRIEAGAWQGPTDAAEPADLVALERRATEAQRARLIFLRLVGAFWSEHCRVDERSMALIEQLLVASEALGDQALIAFSQWVAGQARLLRHELDLAEAQLHAALAVAERADALQIQARSLIGLGIVARLRGQDAAVRDYLARGQALAEAYELTDVLGGGDAAWAWLAWRAAALDDAATYGRHALERWRHSPIMFPLQWTALLPLLAVALAHGQLDEALEHARALLAPTQQRLPAPLDAALLAATAALTSGRHEEGHAELRRALDLAEMLGFL